MVGPSGINKTLKSLEMEVQSSPAPKPDFSRLHNKCQRETGKKSLIKKTWVMAELKLNVEQAFLLNATTDNNIHRFMGFEHLFRNLGKIGFGV